MVSVTSDNYVNALRMPLDTPVEMTVQELKLFFPKKLAALELQKALHVSRILAITIIAGCAIVAISAVFSKYAGAISTGMFSILAAFSFKRDTAKMKDLETAYGLTHIRIVKNE